jgi:hypothetical protein
MQSARDTLFNSSIDQSEIRRIRARSTLASALLAATWLFICAFVLAALWLKWRL